MSKDLFADVEQFHAQFGLLYEGVPRCLPKELQTFRNRFLREELLEYQKEVAGAEFLRSQTRQQILFPNSPWDKSVTDFKPSMTDHLEGMLDGLVDLVYVALGTAQLHGFNFSEAWNRVHEANMTKVRVQRPNESKRNSIFDVVKPPGWVAPSHRDLVSNHEEQPDIQIDKRWKLLDEGVKAEIRITPTTLGLAYRTSFGYTWDLIDTKGNSRLGSTNFFPAIEEAISDCDSYYLKISTGVGV